VALELNNYFVWGIDHHKTPLDIREKFARVGADRLLKMLTPCIAQESLVLSTCNRYEIYGISAKNVQNDIVQMIHQATELPHDQINNILYFKQGEEMLRHGFSVASSLESMVVGEPEILGQMKQAYQEAQQHNTLHTALDRFCSKALHVGKQVRCHTAIATQPVSVASVAVNTAQSIFSDLQHNAVTLIGAGEMGIACAKSLKKSGVENLTIVNRSETRSADIANALDAKVQNFNSLDEAIAQADIIISATASETPIVTPELVDRAFKTRKQKPVFFIDVAVPRDIHPDIQKMDNCFVYDIDQLGKIAQDGKQHRVSQIEKAQAIIEAEIQEFTIWSQGMKNKDVIGQLRENFESARAEVLDKYPSKEVAEATRLLLNKILHKPTCNLKSGTHNSNDVAQFIETFFEHNKTERMNREH
jgi:glutamyl-tRNA reductase